MTFDLRSHTYQISHALKTEDAVQSRNRHRAPVIATSMGFILAASIFTKTSVGFVIIGILTLESFRSSRPLNECICQACILSPGSSFKLADSFDRERRCVVRMVHFNPRIVFCSIFLVSTILNQFFFKSPPSGG